MPKTEILGEGEPTEEPEGGNPGELAGAEFVPEIAAKPKPDAFSALLVLAFVAFLVGIGLTCYELYELYDVQFFIFSKQ